MITTQIHPNLQQNHLKINHNHTQKKKKNHCLSSPEHNLTTTAALMNTVQIHCDQHPQPITTMTTTQIKIKRKGQNLGTVTYVLFLIFPS